MVVVVVVVVSTGRRRRRRRRMKASGWCWAAQCAVVRRGLFVLVVVVGLLGISPTASPGGDGD